MFSSRSAVLPSAHYSAMQNQRTGVIDGTLNGLSESDHNARCARLLGEVHTLGVEVTAMLQIVKTAPRSLFRSSKLKWTSARNSCWSAGDLVHGHNVDENGTRYLLIQWEQRLKSVQHSLVFVAQALVKNKMFVSDYTELGNNIHALCSELCSYQPMHGCWSLCIPRAPYNGCRKLQRASDALDLRMKDAEAKWDKVLIQSMGGMSVTHEAGTSAQHNESTEAYVTGQNHSDTITQDGRTKTDISRDALGRVDVREAVPNVREASDDGHGAARCTRVRECGRRCTGTSRTPCNYASSRSELRGRLESGSVLSGATWGSELMRCRPKLEGVLIQDGCFARLVVCMEIVGGVNEHCFCRDAQRVRLASCFSLCARRGSDRDILWRHM